MTEVLKQRPKVIGHITQATCDNNFKPETSLLMRLDHVNSPPRRKDRLK
jgi:hypothetical protein